MNTSKLVSTFAAFSLALGLSFVPSAQAQEADKLPNYVPVLPQIKARALAVDPQKGYLVTSRSSPTSTSSPTASISQPS